MPGERFTRGGLPHWYKPGHAHFVTYRLAETIPVDRLVNWRRERQDAIGAARRIASPKLAALATERAHKQFYQHYDDFLDGDASRTWLAMEPIAKIVSENLHHHHGSKYQLLAYTIMPNHVHVLLQPYESGRDDVVKAASFDTKFRLHSDEILDRLSPLASIMHSLKSYTANRANEILGRSGQFWQHESYDHWVRDLDELERIIAYINRNPVKAGLCRRAIDWRWSSAADRYARDGSECGLVGWLTEEWRRG